MAEGTGMAGGATDELTCALCSATVAANESKLANGHRVCPACAAQLESELAQGDASAEVLPGAAIFGALGALAGAVAWTVIAVLMKAEIGYLAVLVGFLAGYGVKYGARGQHGKRLQQLAVACAFGGLVTTKYLIFAHFFSAAAEAEGVALGYLSPVTFAAFSQSLSGMLSPFDLLWLFLALSSAWRVPAAPRVNVG